MDCRQTEQRKEREYDGVLTHEMMYSASRNQRQTARTADSSTPLVSSAGRWRFGVRMAVT
jgi:hypothetical protein